MTMLMKPRLTAQEYLERERAAEHRSEYWAGEMFAMAGASEAHNLIVTNVSGELRAQLKSRPCKTYSSDMRVKVEATGLYTYPDVVVVCGVARFEDDHRDTLLNPTVIVEVLSPSTEAYDRGEKFAHYRRIASLTDYLLAAQDKVRVEHFVRQPDDQWLLSEVSDLHASLAIVSIGCMLQLAEVYEKVDFAAVRADSSQSSTAPRPG
jgi:Uma2 family endonuclease